MARKYEYSVRVQQLSGKLIGEVQLPETARVEDILEAVPHESENPSLKRVLVFKGRSLEESEVLCQLGVQAPALLEMQQVVQSWRTERKASLPEACRTMHLGLFGEHRAGKTSLLYRYCHDTFNDRTMMHSIGIDFQVARVMAHDVPVKVMLWDQPAGKERFRTITSVYFRRKEAILLVLDLTNPRSLLDITDWLRFPEAQAIPTKLLIGNKADLVECRKISRKEAEQYARENGMTYFETSAKEGTGVGEAIDYAIFDVLAKEIRPQPVVPETRRASNSRCALQ
ncbi:rab13 [Symbiodinium natans]|uniref:Rab13 protein n=1 Tax=Symbiodinium natans TaxID=878477 RepID=A0A812S6S8_9DINO|nr:rab13 [Symbiodinium natans]